MTKACELSVYMLCSPMYTMHRSAVKIQQHDPLKVQRTQVLQSSVACRNFMGSGVITAGLLFSHGLSRSCVLTSAGTSQKCVYRFLVGCS